MKTIVLSVTNDIVTDQRIHRIATTLASQKANVLVVGRLLPESLPLTRDYQTRRLKLWFTRGALFYAEFSIRLFFFLLFAKTDILVSNDLDTLLPNFLVSKFRRKKLVYDTHEYYTGVPELQSRYIVRNVWETIERLIFPRLSKISTVNNSIARLYRWKYKKVIHVIRNLPVKQNHNTWLSREELGLPVDKNILIIQGSGINVNRGAEEAVLAMKFVSNAILLIVGSGGIIEKLRKMAVQENLQEKVWFKHRMPYNEMMNYTHAADLGLSLDKGTNINYMYSLPNKVFDYIQAGIPVLCSNLVEVVKIIDQYKVGDIALSHDPQYLGEKINSIFVDKLLMTQWKDNLVKAAEDLCWEREEIKLLEFYTDWL